MKRIAIGCLVLLGLAVGAQAEDLRVAAQKANAQYEAASAEARQREQAILTDRKKLTAEVTRFEKRVDELGRTVDQLTAQAEILRKEEAKWSALQAESQLDMREYTGVVRETARELESVLNQSHFTALDPGRLERLTPVLDKDRFPGMDEIAAISELFFEETALSGEVDLHADAGFVNPGGEAVTGEILTIGAFSAAYRSEAGTGFLTYGDASHTFFSLSKKPPWSMRRGLDKYMAGDAEAVPFDFSRGAALRQLSHRSSLVDKIGKGGPVVWPILSIGLLALIIAVERVIFLNRVHANTDRLMGRVNELAAEGQWTACDEVLEHDKGKPVNNVLRAGLSAIQEKRETLESVLQEAILKELPRLERFLPALNILGAVAPLLGLLGTVTGMIATFQAITLHGAGDPRMMSGGISEALVTTMLGLAVAIPIMLLHTFLRRRLDHIVGDMEEKAVALCNIICRECRMAVLPGAPGHACPKAALPAAAGS